MTAASATIRGLQSAPAPLATAGGMAQRRYPLNENHPTCACGCGEQVSLGSRFRHGHWARVQPVAPAAERFWAKVNRAPGQGPHGDCWEWQASTDSGGYGFFWDTTAGRMVKAHRWAYEHSVGHLVERPQGVFGAVGEIVRHSCDNPPCVNPAHLLTGTQQDNMDDKLARGRQPDHGGERNPKAKLTSADIAAIRDSYSGVYGEKMAIARRYNISSGHVSKILAGHVW